MTPPMEVMPHELMIGNYLHDAKGRLCKVEELSYYSFEAPAINCPVTSMPNLPIPLTEKWLEDFGFEYLEYRDRWQKNGISLEDLTGDFELRLTNYEETASIKYVHQLQNLYFALTGNHLTTTA